MTRILLFAIIALAVPSVAEARGHGGGHGGGHGHSGGSRGHGHGHGHGHGSHACTEVSSVVGYRQCSTFGAWSSKAPGLSLDLGLATHRFIAQPLGASGTLMEGANTFGFRFGTEPGQNLVTNTIALQLRAALFLSGPLYVASDVELGGVVSGPRLWAAIDGSEAGPISTTYVAAHGAVGLRAKLEPLALSGEVAGGFRTLEYKIPDETATAYQTRPELQVRARIDVWLSPRMTIGAMLGSSLIDRADSIIAVSLGGHLRAFGGE